MHWKPNCLPEIRASDANDATTDEYCVMSLVLAFLLISIFVGIVWNAFNSIQWHWIAFRYLLTSPPNRPNISPLVIDSRDCPSLAMRLRLDIKCSQAFSWIKNALNVDKYSLFHWIFWLRHKRCQPLMIVELENWVPLNRFSSRKRIKYGIEQHW